MQFQKFSGKGSSFCKIIANNLDKMKVPSKFVEEGLENEIALYHNAILHGPANQIWMVKLLKTGDGKLYLTDGLRKFIEENSIKSYDMVLFNHRGNMCFVVSMLAVTMTEKMPAIARTPLALCHQVDDNPCQVGIVHGSSDEKSQRPCPDDGILIEVCVQDEKRKRGRPRKDRSQPSRVTSTRKHVHGNVGVPNLKRKRQCNQGNKKEVQGEKKKRGRPRKDRSTIHHSMSSGPSTKKHVRGNDNAPNLKRKRPCNPDEVKVVTNIMTGQSTLLHEPIIREQRNFTSQFPYFQCRIGKDVNQKFMLKIPREFFLKHLSHKISIILRNSEKKCWLVSVIHIGKGAHVFSQGFKIFFLKNKLEVGDTCVFELVEDCILNVYVFH